MKIKEFHNKPEFDEREVELDKSFGSARYRAWQAIPDNNLSLEFARANNILANRRRNRLLDSFMIINNRISLLVKIYEDS